MVCCGGCFDPSRTRIDLTAFVPHGAKGAPFAVADQPSYGARACRRRTMHRGTPNPHNEVVIAIVHEAVPCGVWRGDQYAGVFPERS